MSGVDSSIRMLMDDMLETMYDAPGIGLAAVQVGVPLRVLVIDLQPDDPDAEPVACDHDGHHHHHPPTKREPQVFINPEILDPSEEQTVYQEGCLSVPEIYADVERPSRIRARWQDLWLRKDQQGAQALAQHFELFGVHCQGRSPTFLLDFPLTCVRDASIQNPGRY